jgi:hypothetical protein
MERVSVHSIEKIHTHKHTHTQTYTNIHTYTNTYTTNIHSHDCFDFLTTYNICQKGEIKVHGF